MISLSDIPRKGGLPFTLPMAAFLLLLVAAPYLVSRLGLYHYLGIEIAIWIIFAMGFNLLFGYSGLHSFGHGAYLGIGAYGFGLFQHNVAVSLFGGLVAGVLAATLAGALVALFLSHRRGIYYALLTIAFGQIFWFSSIKLHRLTGGEDGLLGIPRPSLELGAWRVALTDNVAFYWFVAAIAGLFVIALWRLVNSPFGRVLQAIRQNEMRARFIGYDVWRWKWLAFTLSAGIAGLAGCLLAMAQNSAYPDVMSLHQSGLVVMMILVGGGLVNFWGPILGVLLYFVAREIIGGITETWLLWYGLMFVTMVMLKPEGVAGLFRTGAQRVPAAPTTVLAETVK